MEDYDIPYGYEPERKFDLTIPILLLILVFLVVAWKVGWLANIPVLNSILGGQTLSILIVGNDADIKADLDEMATELNINYKVIEQAELSDIRNVDYLNNYGMVILTENIYDNPAELSGSFRALLGKYLNGGRKLILYGVAGSRDPQEGISGWVANDMNKFVPVECRTVDKLCDPADPETVMSFSKSTAKLKIYPAGANHPITDGYTTTINFLTGTGSVDIAIVNTVTGASKLVAIEDEVDDVSYSYPAIVEISSGVGGKTVYFAYHPSNTPTIFKNTIKYMLGA